MNLTKLDNTLNTSTNSMNKNAPPSTMPVNKTFANNKLIVRKLQFKTKNHNLQLMFNLAEMIIKVRALKWAKRFNKFTIKPQSFPKASNLLQVMLKINTAENSKNR